ncbi:MAG TPA: hopanoid biosynthesis associated radical SAM protein HpnJ, partial [Steroidobacter sp.]|nr:hopanoid biosynthesis associated radical SAM protein HpnJ [Steroidobacter sp.]
MKSLFLHPPSYEGFDGGAGARYQAKREVRSFWYPTWLAQPAALVPDSCLLDAPADGLSLTDVLPIARGFDLIIMHTSSPSFTADVRTAEALKEDRPGVLIGMVGAKVAVDPQRSLAASGSIDFVAREEFDYTCQEVASGRPLGEIVGLSYRRADGTIVHNAPRPLITDMDALPWVTPVYERDLRVENYFIGYLKHPYVSFYTGRGCRSKCTFCLWPQTVGGHRYRVRSPGSVVEEVRWVRDHLPQVEEIFFDDDTFTDFRPRVEEIARGLGRLGVTWSCNAKANVPYETLRVMKENGLRLLLVGYESGSDQILHNVRKGLKTDIARRFTRDCRELGITIHGTFILGLPGETEQTIRQTIEFAKQINPHTIQVSLAAPYPGTQLYEQALANGWLSESAADLVDERGVQIEPISYPHLSAEQ